MTLTSFHPISVTFVISRNKDIYCSFSIVSNSFFFFEYLKVVLINMVAMPAKLVTLGLLKIKFF